MHSYTHDNKLIPCRAAKPRLFAVKNIEPLDSAKPIQWSSVPAQNDITDRSERLGRSGQVIPRP